VAVQKFKPVVVYLNGEYFGLHFVREKLNVHYVAGNFNTTADNVVLCEQGGYNSSAYRSLLKYAMNHDLRKKEYYDYVCSQIDVDNYIDYMIAQIYIANTDNGNVRFFRIGDGLWTWIMYDTDLSFYDTTINSVSSHLNPNAIGNKDITSKTLAVCLLKNPEFKEKFLRRIAWQLDNIWTEENIISRVDEIEAMISQDMVKDCARWKTSYNGWKNSVETLRKFARRRESRLIGFVQNYFDLTDAQMIEYGFSI
jgi:spore coat protein CotH